ncbi:uncharacterized protein KZ484_018219 [Pholidichthys leucotaenia]
MDGVDDNYIWQRRIAHAVRKKKCTVSFPECVKLGLEFNPCVERKKLDLSLLTNAVVIELCDFARVVTKSEKFFLFEMLALNFDLGLDLDDEKLCYLYAIRVHSKIKCPKEQVKIRSFKNKEPFILPDPNHLSGLTVERVVPIWNKIPDISLLTGGGSNNSQTSEVQKVHSDCNASTMCATTKRGRAPKKSAHTLYPLCAELGVSLAVQPHQTTKQKLDPSLLTYGMMLELLDFSKSLCGTLSWIVYDVIRHNFSFEADKSWFRRNLYRLLETKTFNMTPEEKDAFRKKTFDSQKREKPVSNGIKRKLPVLDDQTLKWKEMSSSRKKTREMRSISQDSDLSYMCPIECDFEMQTEMDVGSEHIKLESSSSMMVAETKLAEDVKRKDEEGLTLLMQPQMQNHSSQLLNGQPKPPSEKVKCHLSLEEKQNLWRRRAVRSEKILKLPRGNKPYTHCKEIGLNFDVCLGTKQNLDLKLFTNFVMWEIYRFVSAMGKSTRWFLLEIFLNNFQLVIHDELHKRNFLGYMLTKEKLLQGHPDRESMEFLNQPLHVNKMYKAADVDSILLTEEEVKAEEQQDLDSSDLKLSQLADMEKYPFCKQIGLNLWSAEECPTKQKLSLNVLTNGVLLEMLTFIRELCGNFHDLVNDILEHNFNLDLQSGKSEAACFIQAWYSKHKSLIRNHTSLSPRTISWLHSPVQLSGKPQSSHQSPNNSGLKDSDTIDRKVCMVKSSSNGEDQQGIQFQGYDTCKEIGLDLDLGSKAEAKPKLDLKVLTRGVLFEVHQYLMKNSNQYVPTLYKILEYNFDLSSQSHRKVEFAWSIASQVMAMVGKTGRKESYFNQVFQLPFEAYESSQVVKEEPEDGFKEPDVIDDKDDLVFVRKLNPVDIEVMID